MTFQPSTVMARDTSSNSNSIFYGQKKKTRGIITRRSLYFILYIKSGTLLFPLKKKKTVLFQSRLWTMLLPLIPCWNYRTLDVGERKVNMESEIHIGLISWTDDTMWQNKKQSTKPIYINTKLSINPYEKRKIGMKGGDGEINL